MQSLPYTKGSVRVGGCGWCGEEPVQKIQPLMEACGLLWQSPQAKSNSSNNNKKHFLFFFFFTFFKGYRKTNQQHRKACTTETVGVSQNLKHLSYGCLQEICWSCRILNNIIPTSQLSLPQREQGKARLSIAPSLSNHLFSLLPFSPANIISKHGKETLLKGLPKQRVKQRRDRSSSYLQGE